MFGFARSEVLRLFRSTSRMWLLGAVPICGMLVVTSTAAAQSGQAGSSPAKGVFVKLGASATAAAVPPRSQPAPIGRPAGFDVLKARANAPQGAATFATASAAPVAGPTSNAPALTGSIAGIGFTGSFPPDPTLAVGTTHIVQSVNSQFRVIRKSDGFTTTATHRNLFDPFYVANAAINARTPFDPWLVYDHFANRFVMVCLTFAQAPTTFETSWFLIAVSKDSNPENGWWLYWLRADEDGSTDTAYWADYQKLGYDNTNWYLTSNQFPAVNGPPVFGKIRVMNKTQFLNGGLPIEWYDFFQRPEFTIQPCVTFGTPGKEYLVASTFNGSSSLDLLSISGTWPNGTLTDPVLTVEGPVAFNAYSFPPDALQPGGAADLDTGDCRLMNAVFRNGVVYTAHATGTPSGRCGCAIKSLDVTTKTKILDVVLGGATDDCFYPTVMVDNAGGIVTTFSRSSATTFAEARYTQKTLSDVAFQPSAQLKAGVAGYELIGGGRNRWGDYSGISLDPADGSVWFTGEYAAGASSWGTWIGSIAGSSSNPPPPPGDSIVDIIYNNGTKSLTINGDDRSGQLTVTLSRGKLTVAAGPKTKLKNNGGLPAVTKLQFNVIPADAALSVQSDLKGGNDAMSFTGLKLSSANMLLGTGNDSMSLNYCTVTGAFALDGDAVTNTGTDAFLSPGSKFLGSYFVINFP